MTFKAKYYEPPNMNKQNIVYNKLAKKKPKVKARVKINPNTMPFPIALICLRLMKNNESKTNKETKKIKK